MKIWQISFYDRDAAKEVVVTVKGNSFDEALSEARKIDRRMVGGFCCGNDENA